MIGLPDSNQIGDVRRHGRRRRQMEMLVIGPVGAIENVGAKPAHLVVEPPRRGQDDVRPGGQFAMQFELPLVRHAAA